jgi:hypothetical protein
MSRPGTPAQEPQPESPDLGASVNLENDETLAGPLGDDPLDAGYVPPDRPYGLDEDGVTGRGMREGDSFEQRLAREEPDEPELVDADRSGRLVGGDQGAALETSDDVEGVDVGIDGGAASAEEAAVHTIDGPGEPVEQEPYVADLPELRDPEVDDEVTGLLDDVVDGEKLAGRAQRDAQADGLDDRSEGAAAPASGGRDLGR